MVRIEIDGQEPTHEELRDAALNTYGHFTAMQVRDGRTRGLDLHLARLDAANRELFGESLDGEHVRELIRHALSGGDGSEGAIRDAAVRVIVRSENSGDGASSVRVFVTVRPPFTMPPDASQRLKSARYIRTVPHIKRPGDFGQAYYIDRAVEAGYDDALLVADDGTVAEAGIANIAFFDGDSVIWPDAPVLAGITMQAVAPRLAEYGMPSRTARVLLADDEVELAIAAEFVKAMNAAYDAVAWDEI
jgi:branched-subunit amino acid aminotransferase/4-amino-4-deoxychorismate lyase